MDHGFGLGIALVNDPLHLAVYGRGHILTVVFGMADLPADKHLVTLCLIVDHTDLFRHAVFHHHGPGKGRGLLDILGSACGNVVQDQLLGNTSAQRYHNGLKHLALCVKHLVFFRKGHSISRRSGACGDDGYGVYRPHLGKQVE